MQRAAPILTFVNVLSLVGATAFAQVPGDAKKGRAFALEVCTPCHVVAENQLSPRRLATAPEFLGIANAIIKPILIVITLPIEILTLGLFTFIINAVLFWFVGHLGIGLVVNGFWAALWGSIILWLASWFLSSILTPRRRVRV